MSQMPSKLKNTKSQTIESLCNRCGKEFSAFLHQMEKQNAKVVCPDCGAENECPPATAKRSAAKG
jgi:DNA-directed RNA polymerase subunit RPC12/RpoP